MAVISVKAVDPLETLFVNGDEVDKALLRDILMPYVRLDEKGRIFPMAPFYRETNKNKIIILLLSRKALALKTGIEEAIAPAELGKLVDMPEGTLRPTLRILAEDKLVDDQASKYLVFSHALVRCAQMLTIRPLEVAQSEPAPAQNRNKRPKASMRGIIEDLADEGKMDDGRTVREIHELMLQRRPGTAYGSLYKIILDMVAEKKLSRQLKEGTWIYRQAI